jgi:hypothetical protein
MIDQTLGYTYTMPTYFSPRSLDQKNREIGPSIFWDPAKKLVRKKRIDDKQGGTVVELSKAPPDEEISWKPWRRFNQSDKNRNLNFMTDFLDGLTFRSKG